MSNDHTPIDSPLDLRDGDRLEFRFQGCHHAGTYDQQQRMCDGFYIVLPAFRGWHTDITDVVRVEVSA